jgi:hypothetical protein
VAFGVDDEFILVKGSLGECDAAGYTSGKAKLSGTIGNFTVEDFDVDVNYNCDVPSDPRWTPQATITGKSVPSSSPVTYVFGFELTDFEIKVAGYAHSLARWVFAGTVKVGGMANLFF